VCIYERMHGICRRNSERIKWGDENPLKAGAKANCAMPKPFDGTDKVGGTMNKTIKKGDKVRILYADIDDNLDSGKLREYKKVVGKIGKVTEVEDEEKIHVHFDGIIRPGEWDIDFMFIVGEYEVIGSNVWTGGKR